MIILIIILIPIISIIVFINVNPAFGKAPNGISSIEKSPNYKNGNFENLELTQLSGKSDNKPPMKAMWKMLVGVPDDKPSTTLPTLKFDKEKFMKLDSNIKIAWFGHSTVLLNIDGIIIITDPIFSKYASPVQFTGIKKFFYEHDMDVEQLPTIDIALLSHDHLDHLDYKTIKKINKKTACFVTPLGVDSHLKKWGVPSEKINSFDWGGSFNFNNSVELNCTPARHFSGRGLSDRNKTLWCSWVIKTEKHKVFFSGDGGYGKHFKDIGEQYGPFDLTLLECGQYNEGWADVHAMPSHTAKSHLDLKGEALLPIHWGKFKLSIHSWYEPIETIYSQSKKLKFQLVTPQIGEIYTITKDSMPINTWWRDIRKQSKKK